MKNKFSLSILAVLAVLILDFSSAFSQETKKSCVKALDLLRVSDILIALDYSKHHMIYIDIDGTQIKVSRYGKKKNRKILFCQQVIYPFWREQKLVAIINSDGMLEYLESNGGVKGGRDMYTCDGIPLSDMAMKSYNLNWGSDEEKSRINGYIKELNDYLNIRFN